MSLDVEKLAEHEILWWEMYYTRDWDRLEDAVKKLRKEQFGVEISDESARAFADAGKEYIIYKKSLADEDEGRAKAHLDIAKKYMRMHYNEINEKIGEKKK